MSLSALQQEYAQHLALLVLHIGNTPGCACALGEGKRSDEQSEINAIGAAGRERVAALIKGAFPMLAMALTNNGKAGGIRNSGHQRKLAQDLDLFIDGVYQTTTEAHRPFGEWWEKQHPLARWGGRFGDGNHYSFEFQGVK